MRTRRGGWRYGWVGASLIVALTAVHAVVPSLLPSLFRRRDSMPEYATSPVRRTDLVVSMTTGGRVDSSNRTVVECELEAIAVGVQGRSVASNGSTTLLSIVEDGSMVKKGDVLAVLDASDYEEMLTTQEMNVERARADCRVAELNLAIARMAIDEYHDGTMLQMIKTMNGQIALAQADIERARGRVDWSHRMAEKGYVPVGQIRTEEFELAKQDFALRESLGKLKVFQKFSAPMWLKILDSDVKGSEAMLTYQKLRVDRHETRLERLKTQVELCTIRAPQDGLVIHANEDMRAIRIEPGITVRQHQRLFYLPDLTRMEVATMLHESVAKDVKPGMRARVRVEALRGRELEGHVVAISQLPAPNNFFSDIRYFTASVHLDTIPEGLKPGMTAEVEIETLFRHDVLTIPVEALTCEEGHDFCYVAHDDGLERREVKLGQNTRDRLEVIDGLNEGEAVVLDPSHLEGEGDVAVAVEGPDDVLGE